MPDFKYRFPEWMDDGRCNDKTGKNTELFFSDSADKIEAAKVFCRICPVKVECLDFAIVTKQEIGVWGGALIRYGKIIDTPQLGRPPKK